jgi:branched-chain amino acid aminotransferase
MRECSGEKFILNGDLMDSVNFDSSLIYEGDSVYEVMRMLRRIPVFYPDHMERLESSVRYQGKKMLADKNELRQSIIKLTRSDREKEANLKIVFNYNSGKHNYLVYYVEPLYPTGEQYETGVKGILFNAERKDPASKVINHRLRSDIYHKLILEGAYEALLVDKSKLITEGSRSNIFFIREGTLYTAPENVILSGITRKYILGICNERGIKVVFECVRAADISKYDAVFMTGTSPMVLPFCLIDDRPFNTKLPVMSELRELFMEKARDSIMLFRSG